MERVPFFGTRTSKSRGEKNLMMIPKLIHFMWKDKQDLNNHQIPGKYEKYVQSWKTMNPEFQFLFWFNQEIDMLWQDSRTVPYRKVYSKMQNIEQCDMSRYIIMWFYGGTYVDLNTMCFKNISPLLDNRDIAFSLEPVEHKETFRYDELVTNSYLMSTTNHPFWQSFLNYITSNYWPSQGTSFVMINTGPCILARFVSLYFSPTPEKVLLSNCLTQPYVNIGDGKSTVTRTCCAFDSPTPFFAKFWKDTAGWGVNNDQAAKESATLVVIFVFLLIIVLFVVLFLFRNRR